MRHRDHAQAAQGSPPGPLGFASLFSKKNMSYAALRPAMNVEYYLNHIWYQNKSDAKNGVTNGVGGRDTGC